MEDSLGLEVWALFKGRPLQVGLGCGENGGTGPTRVSYLHGARAGAARTVAAAIATAAAIARVLWLAGGAAVAGGSATAASAVAGSGPRLEPPKGGGEEGLTLGLWLSPPHVLAMHRLEKERRWREWEEEVFCFEGNEMV